MSSYSLSQISPNNLTPFQKDVLSRLEKIEKGILKLSKAPSSTFLHTEGQSGVKEEADQCYKVITEYTPHKFIVALLPGDSISLLSLLTLHSTME